MTNPDRRKFLQALGAGAAAGALPASIARATEIAAARRTGTIEDVQHIVILMQENRSFDHHFGTLRGVRGFADPRAVQLPSGKPVWYQPSGNGELLPFRPPVDSVGSTFLPDPPHGWNDTHGAWNNGKHDQWVPNKGNVTMTYHRREDIPFHYALADAFTICDAYHCSLMGPTDPNRYHMWTGWVGNDGKAGGPVIDNAELGYDWSTYPERLQRNGISWKVYQDVGVGLDAAGYWGWTDDPYIGNYGDNSLLYFHQYQNAQPGNPLADRAKTGTAINNAARDPNRLVEIFLRDVASGQLPQVSWIVAPEAYSEHPNHPANYGAWYIAQFLDALTANPEVWSKTMLLINYDEEGGFLDHMVPPTPPMNASQGASTVPITNEIFAGDSKRVSAPYGLGMRVPMLVVSPWSKGGWVNSQLFDHTSVIRFLEARFAKGKPDLIESNITPWRRAVVGDLTSAFDFEARDRKLVALPSTAAFLPPDLARHPDYVIVPPADAKLPAQETGVRMARALPYALDVAGSVISAQGALQIEFINRGRAAAVFHARPVGNGEAPRSYTVEARKTLSDAWPVLASGKTEYDFTVHGPNGFVRTFKGSVGGSGKALLDIRTRYRTRDFDRDDNDDDDRNDRLVFGMQRIMLLITNRAGSAATVRITDQYNGKSTKFKLDPQQTETPAWELRRTFGWYDLLITVEGDAGYQTRLAGHVENGLPSISDPLMGG